MPEAPDPAETDRHAFTLLLSGIAACRRAPGIPSHMGYRTLYRCGDEPASEELKAHLFRLYGIYDRESLEKVCMEQFTSGREYEQFMTFWCDAPLFDLEELEEEARKLKKKLVKNQFNFNDFIGQIQQIKKMGNLKDLASMLPGMGKMLKNVDIPDDVFKQTEAIISSMTPAERERPEIINARRRERIAKGSGTTMADVNRLMKQFEDTRKMMKAVAGGGMKMPKMPGMRR